MAIARCHALDASVFPHSSLPSDLTRDVLVARSSADLSVVGFIATRRIGWRLEIIGLAIDPDHRRQGYGAALLSGAAHMAQARGVRELALHVAVQNTPAIALYEREGFVQVRRLRGFYRSGDAFQMVRKFCDDVCS